MHKLFRWSKMFTPMNYSLFMCVSLPYFFFRMPGKLLETWIKGLMVFGKCGNIFFSLSLCQKCKAFFKKSEHNIPMQLVLV